MGIFDFLKPKSQVNGKEQDHSTQGEHFIEELKMQVDDEPYKFPRYETIEDFIQDLSNEDVYIPIMEKIAVSQQSELETDLEGDKKENTIPYVSDEEKKVISNNAMNGNFTPTRSIPETFSETTDIRVTKFKQFEEGQAKLTADPYIHALLDYVGKNRCLSVTIPITHATLNIYHDMLQEKELVYNLTNDAYKNYIKQGKEKEEAQELAYERAKSMLKGRALSYNMSAGGVHLFLEGKALKQNIFLKSTDLRKEEQVIHRTPERVMEEKQTEQKQIKETVVNEQETIE